MLLGASFTATFSASDAGVHASVLSALAASSAFDLDPQVKARIWNTQTEVVSQLIAENGIVHDGYSFQWEGVGVDHDGPDDAIYVSVAINLVCKDDDFLELDDLLNKPVYEERAAAALLMVFRETIVAKGVDPDKCSVSVAMDGFGYS